MCNKWDLEALDLIEKYFETTSFEGVSKVSRGEIFKDIFKGFEGGYFSAKRAKVRISEKFLEMGYEEKEQHHTRIFVKPYKRSDARGFSRRKIFEERKNIFEGRKPNTNLIIRDSAITIYKKKRITKKTCCDLCGENPSELWKGIKGYLYHIHHKWPLSFRDNLYETTLEDLVILCPICHMVIHKFYKTEGYIPYEEIKMGFEEHKNSKFIFEGGLGI